MLLRQRHLTHLAAVLALYGRRSRRREPTGAATALLFGIKTPTVKGKSDEGNHRILARFLCPGRFNRSRIYLRSPPLAIAITCPHSRRANRPCFKELPNFQIRKVLRKE